jgi:trigger factor
LLAQKKDAEMKRREEELYEKVKSATSVTLPEELIDAEAQDILRDFVERLKEQGATLDQWMEQQKKEPQKLLDEMRDIAKNRATLRLGMQELAKALKVEPTEDDMKAQIDALKTEAKKSERTLDTDELTPGGSIYESVKFDATMRLLVEKMIA